MRHANVIIAGKTGVGKSTLINAVFGENLAKTGIGTPVTTEEDMKWYEKENVPLRLCDTVGLELDEEKRNRSQAKIKEICQIAKRSNNQDSVMWYCVASDSDRLEPYEADYINSVSKDVNVILVITKSYRKKHSERLRRAIQTDYPGLKVKGELVLLAQDENPEDCDEGEILKKAYGVDTLMELTTQILSESALVESKISRAHTVVLTTATASFGEGFMPLPFSDALALVPTEVAMLAKITSIFGVSVPGNMLKSIVTSLAGTAGATIAGKTIVSNLLKIIPGVGTVVGGAISGVTAATLTIALGETYIVIMKMIAEGEINAQSLETKAVQDKLKNIFKDQIGPARTTAAKMQFKS